MELEKLEKAKIYMEKLAQGFNPLDDQPIRDDFFINNVRMSRCFFYVADILRQAIENNGFSKTKKQKKLPFNITEEQLSNFSYSSSPISITNLVSNINALINTEHMKKITTMHITNWLTTVGILELVEVGDKKRKLPTKIGNEIGITLATGFGMYGPYEYCSYNLAAQKFIIDNMFEIIGTVKK